MVDFGIVEEEEKGGALASVPISSTPCHQPQVRPSRSVPSVTPLSPKGGDDKLFLIIGPLVTLSAEQSMQPSDGTGDVQGEYIRWLTSALRRRN